MFIVIYELTLVLMEIKNTYFPDYKFALIFFFEKAVQSLVVLEKIVINPVQKIVRSADVAS